MMSPDNITIIKSEGLYYNITYSSPKLYNFSIPSGGEAAGVLVPVSEMKGGDEAHSYVR
jgi:hypothetical protein